MTTKIATARAKRAAAADVAALTDRVDDPPSKLDQLVVLLARPTGATLAEMIAATGWQPHSVRGALAGALKKRGHVITSDKVDGVRIYRIAAR